MSSAIAPSMIWLENTKRMPSAMLLNTGARGPVATGSSTFSGTSTPMATAASTAATE